MWQVYPLSAVRVLFAAVVIAGLALGHAPVCSQDEGPKARDIELPRPTLNGAVSFEAAIARRRSVRELAPTALTMAQIGQLAWAAQGITDPETGHRTAPSAGATYPLELYLVTPKGLLHYIPEGHKAERLSDEDLRPKLREAGWRQRTIAEAPLVIVMAAIYERTAARFGERATRYVHIEAGHVGQNVQLQAVALGLASVPLGVSDDEGRVRGALGLPEDQEIVYVMCVGHKRES